MKKINIKAFRLPLKMVGLMAWCCFVQTVQCSAQDAAFENAAYIVADSTASSFEIPKEGELIYDDMGMAGNTSVNIKKEFRLLKVIKVTATLTESMFSIEGTADVDVPGTGFAVGGKAMIGWDLATQKKSEVLSGYIRGHGSELTIDGNGNVGASYTEGPHKIIVRGNTSGEFSNAEYNYNGGSTKIKIVGDATGKITSTVSYATATASASFSGGITVVSNGTSVTGLAAAANMTYAPQGAGYTFTIGASSTYTFSNDDFLIMIYFGFSF